MLTPSDVITHKTWFVQQINGEVKTHGPMLESEAKTLAGKIRAIGDKAILLNTSWQVQTSVLRTQAQIQKENAA